MKRSVITQISSVLRIVRGERDALVRTTHFKAAVENVSIATIERKIMSTKTTLKRIALVAVAATGFGLMSVVPSSATHFGDTLTISDATDTMAIGGTSATTTVTQSFLAPGGTADSMTVTASVVSSPATMSAVPVLTVGAGSVNTTPVVVGQVVSVNANSAAVTTGVITATLNATVAGVYIIKFTPATLDTAPAGAVSATAVTWTVTVGAAKLVSASHTLSLIGPLVTPALTAAAETAAGTLNHYKAALTTGAGSQLATILVTPLDDADAALNTNVAISAKIVSGPGSLGIAASAGAAVPAGRDVTDATTRTAHYVGIWGDGTSGTTVVNIYTGTTLLSTESFVFYGDIASITATKVSGLVHAGVTNTAAITVVAKDSNQVTIPVGNVYFTSSDLTVINNSYSTVDLAVGTVSLVTLVAGTANITFSNANTAAGTTVTSNVVAMRVAAAAATATIAFDKSAYALGEKATVTVSIRDAAGLPVDKTAVATAFAAGGMVSNFALTGADLTLASVTPLLDSGDATYTVYLPAYAADITLTATGGAGLATDSGLTITSPTVSVSDTAADAASAAAAEATDNAIAAYEAAVEATSAAEDAGAAALAAQESADAALEAVTTLGTDVAAAIQKISDQITAINVVLVKLGTTLAKLAAKK